MTFRTLRLLLLPVLTLLCTCQKRPVSEPEGQAGPRYSLAGIRDLSYQDPERALRLLDSAEIFGRTSVREADLLRAEISYSPLQDDEKALLYARKAYEEADTLTTSPQERMYILDLLCRISAIREQFESGIRYASEGLQLSLREGDARYEALFLFQAGNCMLRIGQRDAGYRHLEAGIDQMEHLEDPSLLSTLSLAYGELMCALSDDGRYKDAIRQGRRRETILLRMEEDPERFSPGETDLQKASLFAKMAHYLAKYGDPELAREYESRFWKTAFSQLPQGRILLVEYYGATGQYQRLLDLYGDNDYPAATDTLTDNVAYYLRRKAEALHFLGHNRDAYGLLRRADRILDSLHRTALAEKAMALSESYASRYKDAQVARAQAESARRMGFVHLLGAALVALLVLFVLERRHSRTVRQKNRALAAELEKKLQYQEELRTIRKRTPRQGNPRAGGPSSADLFNQLEDLMDREQLFLESDLSREDILRRLHIDKNRLAQMFREAGGGVSLPAYINEKRLTHSLKLLRAHPNYTIQTIALDAGFANSRNFHALFKERYGMTPTEFLRSIGEKGRGRQDEPQDLL